MKENNQSAQVEQNERDLSAHKNSLQRSLRQEGLVERKGNSEGRSMLADAAITSSQMVVGRYDLKMMRRIRVNRILMRKRRHERAYSPTISLLTTAAITIFVIVMILSSGGTGAAYAYYQSQMPLLDGIAQHSLFQTTHIYDRNGKLLYELFDQSKDHGRRTYVDYNDISPLIVNATIAAEDHTFWMNSGVDFQGIIRAAVQNVARHGVVEGGSTITQQLIKNQFFSGQPRNLQLKGEEAILASGLTQQYPKWKIMEMYLNTVFYGNQNYGIEAAAEDYFGLKPQCTNGHCTPAVSRLTLGQASLLAGLPQGPTGYNPVYYKDNALKRQDIVLQAMVDQGFITSLQKAQAQKEMEDFKFPTSYAANHPKNAPHFVDYLIDRVLLPLFGAENLENSGYNIYTTLDLDLEQKVEQITHDRLYTPTYNEFIINPYGILAQTHNVKNAAVTVINPRTGEILAMDGSAAYNDPSIESPQMQGQVNAALTLRPPGSSFKPVIYATDFELGWYPGMIVPDQPTYFPDGVKPYAPKNYDRKYHGTIGMTIRRAIANSFNIPAIEGFEYGGVDNVLNMAGRLGLTHVQNYPKAKQGAAMGLGVAEESLLNMTAAYGTFANNGIRMPATSILQITDNQGRTIYQLDPNKQRGIQAVREDVSFLISSILSDNKARYEEFGPGNPLELDRPVAAKTGTTDDFADNWTLGYTPYLAVGVWAGNDDDSPMGQVIGITGAAPIWHDVIEYASQKYNLPPTGFIPPGNVHQVAVSATTGLVPRPGEPVVTDWMIDGTQPTVMGNWYIPSMQNKPGDGKHKNNDGNGNGNNGSNPPDNGNSSPSDNNANPPGTNTGN